MDLNVPRVMRRRDRHRAMVREEIFRFQQRFADGAHAAVLEKLARDDLTSYYVGILRDVERALRPHRPGMLERLGVGRGWSAPRRPRGPSTPTSDPGDPSP